MVWVVRVRGGEEIKQKGLGRSMIYYVDRM